MDRINGADWVDIGGGKRGFRSEDLPNGLVGTEVTDDWLNMVQEEIIKVIEEANLILDPGDWTQLWKAIRFMQLRDGYFSVTDQRNDPPVGPAIGDRYIVGLLPTGDWVGHENAIAFWLGAWAFISPDPWMHVGFANRTDWRWDNTLGVPAWVPWVAGATVRGPVNNDDIKAMLQGGGVLTDIDLAELVPITLIHETRAGASAPYFLTNDWATKRKFNTVVTDQIGITLSSFQMTMPAGIYRVEVECCGFDAGHHRCRLYNVTGEAVLAYGTSCDSYAGVGTQSTLSARITLAVPSIIEVQHKSDPNGIRTSGDDSNVSPDSHVDAWIFITREKAL